MVDQSLLVHARGEDVLGVVDQGPLLQAGREVLVGANFSRKLYFRGGWVCQGQLLQVDGEGVLSGSRRGHWGFSGE